MLYGMRNRACVMKEIYDSASPAQTERIAQALAAQLRPGDVLAFFGPMGMGKTCFTRGLCRGLGFHGDVCSPTFALVNVYEGGRLPVFHFDMYRIVSWEDLYTTGFFDYLEQGGVTVVEWSENIENALPNRLISVTMEKTGENARRITVDWGEER